MRYAGIRQHEGAFTVVLMCRVLEVSRAGYYRWRRRRPSARAQTDTRLRVVIRAIHAASQRRYGRPRIHRELRDTCEVYREILFSQLPEEQPA